MTYKQQTILKLLDAGKNLYEISSLLRITKDNLYSTIYQMRKKGMNVSLRRVAQKVKRLTPAQRAVLACYAREVSVSDIANSLHITCQTVLNHASEGFKRLGMVSVGRNRIVQLQEYFVELDRISPPTMDDPEFN